MLAGPLRGADCENFGLHGITPIAKVTLWGSSVVRTKHAGQPLLDINAIASFR